MEHLHPMSVIPEMKLWHCLCRSEDYNAGVRLHGKPQTMLTDDAVYIVQNGYTL